MDYPKILLPYNFTSYDKKALDFVCSTFSDKKEAEVTLFNAYTPVPTIEMRGSPIMEQMKDTLSYLSQRVKEQKDALQTIKNHLLGNGFSEDNIDIIFEPKKKDVAGDIIDLAQDGKFDVVVLNRKPGKIARFFAGKEGISTIVSLPISLHGKLIGVLRLYHFEQWDVSERDLDSLMIFTLFLQTRFQKSGRERLFPNLRFPRPLQCFPTR